MEKNFIEKVTNLEREKVKYVPKKLFERFALVRRTEKERTLWLFSECPVEQLGRSKRV